MTEQQLHILQHSLGVDQYGRGRMYRNCFVTEPTCADGVLCESLVVLGFMSRCDYRNALTGGMPVYQVTKKGKAAMLEASPSPPKLTRSKARYQQFLDADSGLRFFEWLKCKRA